ncbi:hypothetical protein [Ramlibacter sp.]|uniref:hypothetical protein n=1 Tax=Ramlibacter sp. TaxID=1917967 RepID=UPI003D147A7D
MNTAHIDLDRDPIDLVWGERPKTIVLASVHRPTFTQQLTVLRDSLPQDRALGTVILPKPRIRAVNLA